MLWTCLCVSMKKKTNFESFSVGQNLVIFQKKHKKREFSLLFFDPPFFRPETDKLPKKSHRSSQMTNIFTKKILMTLGQILTEKIHNLEPGGVKKKTLNFCKAELVVSEIIFLKKHVNVMETLVERENIVTMMDAKQHQILMCQVNYNYMACCVLWMSHFMEFQSVFLDTLPSRKIFFIPKP